MQMDNRPIPESLTLPDVFNHRHGFVVLGAETKRYDTLKTLLQLNVDATLTFDHLAKDYDALAERLKPYANKRVLIERLFQPAVEHSWEYFETPKPEYSDHPYVGGMQRVKHLRDTSEVLMAVLEAYNIQLISLAEVTVLKGKHFRSRMPFADGRLGDYVFNLLPEQINFVAHGIAYWDGDKLHFMRSKHFPCAQGIPFKRN